MTSTVLPQLAISNHELEISGHCNNNTTVVSPVGTQDSTRNSPSGSGLSHLSVSMMAQATVKIAYPTPAINKQSS